MRLLTGIALEPEKGVTARRGIDDNDVFIRNGGQVILVPDEMLDALVSELLACDPGRQVRAALTTGLEANPVGPTGRPLIASSVEAPPFEERDGAATVQPMPDPFIEAQRKRLVRDNHPSTCLCSECDPHGLEVPRDRQPLPSLVIRNKRGPVSPRTIDPDCWVWRGDESGWGKVVFRTKGADGVMVRFADGVDQWFDYSSVVTLAEDVTHPAECEGSELPASSGAWDVVG